MNVINSLITGYENTELLRYDEIPASFPGLVAWEDLPVRAVKGVLKANYRVKDKLMQLYSDEENHVGVIAATRLGKTTSYIIPTILSFARQKEKRSMVITDPKGEIYRATAETLRREGYRIRLINFRDRMKSEFWNPLTPIYRAYLRAQNVEDEVELVEVNGVKKNRFMGVVYDNQRKLDEAIEAQRRMMLDDVSGKVDDLASMIVTVPADDDEIWNYGARDLFKAVLFGMLEDIDSLTNPITEETFSISTALRIIDAIDVGSEGKVEDMGFFSERSEGSKALELAQNIILSTARGTRSSYYTTLVSKLTEYREITTRTITSCNSFEISDICKEEPVAVFIDFRDEIKSYYQTIALFVQDMYKGLIEAANQRQNGKLEHPWYFILDEFGNFPKIKDFETVISACAGRNIWFVLVLQSYAQLDNVYGQNTAKIIRDNLNVSVFFGSNNYETLKAFSEECGEFTRFSPTNALHGEGREIDQYHLETIPRIPKSMLSSFEAGECVVREVNKRYVMFSKLERCFTCEEMASLPKSDESTYRCEINPLDKKYIYTLKRRGVKKRW